MNLNDLPGQAFAYQDLLTEGPKLLRAPGLINVPSLDATLRMHREYEKRLGPDAMYDNEYEHGPRRICINWTEPYEEMTYDILVALEIVAEIRKGLRRLEALDASARQSGAANTDSIEALDPPIADSGGTSAHSPFTDDADQRIFAQARQLVENFRGIEGDWVVDEYQLHAERVAPWDPGIRDVTVHENIIECPYIESVEGLEDWNDIDESSASLDGWIFSTETLVAECSSVLFGIADLILRMEE